MQRKSVLVAALLAAPTVAFAQTELTAEDRQLCIDQFQERRDACLAETTGRERARCMQEAAKRRAACFAGEADENGLPPDPGPATNEGIAGVDSDNDGVRDDVERAIYTLYRGDEEMLAVQLFGARAVQMTLNAGNVDDDVASDLAADATFRWVTCLVEVETERGHGAGWVGRETAKIKLLTLNTELRRTAAAAYERLRDGTAVIAPDSDPTLCGGR